MSALHALIFDFDGLILDTEHSAFESTRQAFARYDVELTLERWHHRVGSASSLHWADELQSLAAAPIDRSGLVEWRDRLKLELLAPEEVRPGVADLMAEASDAGVALAVASSSPADWVLGHLERLGLRARFDTVVTRTDLGDDRRRVKPAPDLYELALQRLGAAAATGVAIEDSPNGVAAARAAGLACVAIPCSVTAPLDFSAAQLVATSLAEVRLVQLGALVVAT